MFSFSIGKTLVGLGIIFILVGFVALIAEQFGLKLFRLPGDIVIERESGSFYFPVVTCLVLSVLVSGILYVMKHLL